MRATRIIAWLLLSYWVLVGGANLIFFQGISLRGSIEFFIYAGIGGACYLVTIKLGGLLSRHQGAKGNKETFRW